MEKDPTSRMTAERQEQKMPKFLEYISKRLDAAATTDEERRYITAVQKDLACFVPKWREYLQQYYFSKDAEGRVDFPTFIENLRWNHAGPFGSISIGYDADLQEDRIMISVFPNKSTHFMEGKNKINQPKSDEFYQRVLRALDILGENETLMQAKQGARVSILLGRGIAEEGILKKRLCC